MGGRRIDRKLGLVLMACFCSWSSAITFRFARIARSSRPFA
jgi:hypothetical protein